MKQQYEKYIIEGLFHEYFSTKNILKYSLFARGVENSNYLIETDEKKYVLKIFENSHDELEVIENEVQIMTDSRECGIHVPEILGTKNSGTKIIQGPEDKPVVLMEYIEGVQFDGNNPEEDFLMKFGKETALLHLFLKENNQKYIIPDTHIFDFKYLINNKSLRNITGENLDRELLEKVWREIDNTKEIFFNLEQQIIHNDLNSGNVILGVNNQPYFIDFTDIVRSARVQDIAITFTQWFFVKSWYPEGMKQYLTGYESVIKFGNEEKQCLFVGVLLRMLNILFIPYLETGLGEPEDFAEQTKRYMNYIERFHEFGKDNFMKLIP